AVLLSLLRRSGMLSRPKDLEATMGSDGSGGWTLGDGGRKPGGGAAGTVAGHVADLEGELALRGGTPTVLRLRVGPVNDHAPPSLFVVSQDLAHFERLVPEWEAPGRARVRWSPPARSAVYHLYDRPDARVPRRATVRGDPAAARRLRV